MTRDGEFLLKLQRCGLNLGALRELITRNTQKGENTIQTIDRCLSQGILHWLKSANNGQFEFNITVNSQAIKPQRRVSMAG
jgi:hypothetical protein